MKIENDVHIKKLNKMRIRQNKMFTVFCIFSLVVCVAVFWQLRIVGITISDEACCGKTAHTHTEECVIEQELICRKEENAKTIVKELCCQIEEHRHTEMCFKENTSLTCEVIENESAHLHGEDCYLTEVLKTCLLEEHVHEEACWFENTSETEGHIHSGDCYNSSYSCGIKEEHTHEMMCYSDPGADIELRSEWEDTIPDELTGIWSEDVVTIAKSQIGYKESENNFILAEDGETRKGYTRYGDWAGNPYGNWNAMFAAFCIHYAGIPEDVFPVATGGNAWKVKLTEQELYLEKENYLPKEGDLVFLNLDISDNEIDVGIVHEIDWENETIKTIEGDSSNSVQYGIYDLNDTNLLGYGIIPDNPQKLMVDEEDDESTVQERLENTLMVASEAGGNITNTYNYEVAWDEKKSMISQLLVSASCNKKNAYIRIEYSDDGGESWTSIATSGKLNANTVTTLDAKDALNEAPLNRQIRVYSYANNDYGYTASFGLHEILENIKPGFCDWLVNSYVQNFNGVMPTTQDLLYDAFALYHELPDVTIETHISGGSMIIDATIAINGISIEDTSGYTYLWEYQTEDGIWKTLSESTAASLDTSSLDEEKLNMLNDGGRNVRCTLYEEGCFEAISNTVFVNPIQGVYNAVIGEINAGLGLGDLAIQGTKFNDYFYYGNVKRDEDVPFYDAQSYANYLAKVYLDAGGSDAGLAAVKKIWDTYLYDLYDPSNDNGTLSNLNEGYPANGSTYGDQNLGWPKDTSSSFHGNVKVELKELNYEYLEDGVDYSNFITGGEKTAIAIRPGDENTERKYDIDIVADAQAKAKGPVVLLFQIPTLWHMFDLAHANALIGDGATERGAASYNTELANLYDIKQALLRFVDYIEKKYPGNNFVLGITETQHGKSSSMLRGTDNYGKDLYVSNSHEVLRSGLLNWDTFGNCEHVHYDTNTLVKALTNLESNLKDFKDVYGYEIAYKDIQKCVVVFGGPTENSSNLDGYGCTLPWGTFQDEQMNSVYGIRVNNGTPSSANSSGLISWIDNPANMSGEPFNDGEGTTYTEKFVATNEDAIFNTLIQIAEQEIRKNGVDLEGKEEVHVENVVLTDTVSKEFFIDDSEPMKAIIYDKNGNVLSEKVISPDDSDLQIINNDDGSTTITYNFGEIYNTQKCKLHFRIEAQEDFIGSNNVFSNEGTPELVYEHNSSRGEEKYFVDYYNTPQVNVPIRFDTVDGIKESILVGETVDLADLSTEIASNAEGLIDNYGQINGVLSYVWVLPDGTEINAGSVKVSEGNIGEQTFPDRSYLFEGTEIGQYTGTLKITFSPEAVDSTNKNFSDTNTAVAVNSLTNQGDIWINVLSVDSTEQFIVRKKWRGDPPDGANVQFCLKSNGQTVLDDNGEELIWTLSEENNWETKIQGLPSVVDGIIQNYSVEEINIPEGYSVSYNTEIQEDVTYAARILISFIPTKNLNDANLIISYQYNNETRTLTQNKVSLQKNKPYTCEVDGLPVTEDGTPYTCEIVSIKNGKNSVECSDMGIKAETYQSGMIDTDVKVITNAPSFVLPETGGSGTNWYTCSGLLLMAIALMYGYISRRKLEGGLRE